MRDLASLARKLEMLPWDEWGPMEDSYNGRTGDAFDRLIDHLAAATHDPDPPQAATHLRTARRTRIPDPLR
jgi:hypothetical protein